MRLYNQLSVLYIHYTNNDFHLNIRHSNKIGLNFSLLYPSLTPGGGGGHLDIFWVGMCRLGPGGDSHMKQTGMLVGNFEVNS